MVQRFADWQRRPWGFSLIELLLVVLIIGCVFALLLPKLVRMRLEARYELVRQNCTELTSVVEKWLQHAILAQDSQQSHAGRKEYLNTLAGRWTEDDPFVTEKQTYTAQWIATATRPNNWNENNLDRRKPEQLIPVHGRVIGKKRNAPPEAVVSEFIAGSKGIANPFNGFDIFSSKNDPQLQKQPVPGAIAFASVLGPRGKITYGFCFQGRDSTTLEFGQKTTFHNGQYLLDLSGIEKCIIIDRY